MTRTIIAAIAIILAVPAFAAANDAIDKAAKEKGAVKTSSGKIYRLDDQGNARIAAALRSDPDRTNVTVSGKIEGQTITVESIDLN